MDVAELRILLSAQNDAKGPIDETTASLEKTTDAAKNAGSAADSSGAGFLGLGAKLIPIVGGVTAVGGALTSMIGSASEAQDVTAQLDAAIASTGGRAGVTRDQVLDLASSLSAANGLSKFSDEAIASADTLLLKFGNIGADVFPQATQAIVDMATRMGSDPVSAATSLGRALDNPTKGLALLARQGVSFTDDQKALVASLMETGDTAGAQKVILDQLAATYGGAAAASAETFSGKMATMQDRIGEVMEGMGTKLLPVVTQVMDFLGSPAVMGVVEALAGLLANSLGGAITFVQNAISFLTPYVQPIVDLFTQFAGALQSGADPLASIGTLLSGLGGQLGTIGGQLLEWVGSMIPGFVAQLGQWTQSFMTWAGEMAPVVLGKLGEFAGQVFQWIGENAPGILAQLGTWAGSFLSWVGEMAPVVLGKLGEFIGQVLQWIGENGPGILAQLGQWGMAFVDWVLPMIPPLLGKLMELLGGVLGWLAQNLPTIIGKLAEWGMAFINWVAPMIPPLLGKLGELALQLLGWLAQQVPVIIGKLAEWGGAFLGWIGKDVLPFIGGKLGEFATSIWNWITTTAGEIITRAAEIGKGLIDGFVNKIKDDWNRVTQFATDLWNWLTSIPGKILTAVVNIGSSIIGGIVQGLKNAGDQVMNFIMGLVNGAVDAVKSFFGISSPSKLMAGFGEDVGMGLAIGIGNSERDVVGAMTDIANKVAGVPIEAGLVASNGGRASGPGDAFRDTSPLVRGAVDATRGAIRTGSAGSSGPVYNNPVFIGGDMAFSSVPDEVHDFFVEVERHKNGMNGGPRVGGIS